MNTIALFSKQVGKSCNLPYALQAWREHDGIRIQAVAGIEENTEVIEYCMEGTGQQKIVERGEVIAWRIYERKELGGHWEEVKKNIPKNNCTKWFDYDKIGGAVIFRKGKKTDKIQLDEKGHHKCFYKLCRDEKISARDREDCWVFADGDQIVWFPGVRMSECYKISQQTRYILEITITSEIGKV